MACYVVNTSADDDSGKKKCSPVLEDYYECLHHKKEVGSDTSETPVPPHEPRHVRFGTDSQTACESPGDPGRVRASRNLDGTRQCAEREANTQPGTSR